MDKLDHKSKDILGGNIEKVAELFPGVVTEAQDEVTGELRKVVDFDLLRQHLGDQLVEGDRERFRLDWPGKKASILKANTPTTKTLRPVREDSEDFDTTQNVFIEGDNFEVLKVLQESYLGRVKMIYIDPPYNTGKDFIYRDNFTQDKGEYEEELGVRDDENDGKLVKNTETNGRYHSDWLSMMQERLIVARDLLTDDGVIFISIDDNEQANLKSLADEVFGKDNFVETLKWKRKKQPSFLALHTAKMMEYILVYAKKIENLEKLSIEGLSDATKKVVNITNQNSERTFTAGVRVKTGGDGVIPRGVRKIKTMSVEYADDIVYRDGRTTNTVKVKAQFSVSQEKINEYIKSDLLFITTNNGLRRDVSAEEREKRKSITDMLLDWGDNQDSDNEMRSLFGQNYFDYTKPTKLIGNFIKSNFTNNQIVMDFFSGSGTTAHAVMQLNAEDGGNRKHIQVQLAEPTDPSSEAYKAGYKSIPEISRERIRRAGKKIREDYAEQIAKRDTPLDTGFRAYKLSSSNFIDTAQHPNETTQASLLSVTNNIVEGRSAEDLLTEVILDLGLTLDLPIEQRDIAEHNVYFVGGNSLVACFDDAVSLDIIDGIAAEKPLRVVFKDSSFANDETRINIDIRLKQLSPDTTVQVV